MKIRVKFFWRDFWIGFYLSDEESKLVICLIPTLPIIIEWGKSKMNLKEQLDEAFADVIAEQNLQNVSSLERTLLRAFFDACIQKARVIVTAQVNDTFDKLQRKD